MLWKSAVAGFRSAGFSPSSPLANFSRVLTVSKHCTWFVVLLLAGCSGEEFENEPVLDVIIRKQEQARDGQIVAVRDEEGEATLKKIYRDRNRFRHCRPHEHQIPQFELH